MVSVYEYETLMRVGEFRYVGPRINLRPVARFTAKTMFAVRMYVIRFLSKPYYTVTFPVFAIQWRMPDDMVPLRKHLSIESHKTHRLHGTFRWLWLAKLSAWRFNRPHQYKHPVDIHHNEGMPLVGLFRALCWVNDVTYAFANW